MHVIVTMTLEQVEKQSGVALTATGCQIPVAAALALAARQRRYLAVFDHTGRTLHFCHEASHRSGNLDQRLALFACERGCAGPGCTEPAIRTQTHHRNRDFAAGSPTGINDLTLACYRDHPKQRNDGITVPEGWYTRTGAAGGPNAGRTEFVPPASVDPQRRGRVNNSHHPERLLAQAQARVWEQREAAEACRQRVYDEFEAAQRAQRRQHVRQMRESGQTCGCADCQHTRAP
jgi:hypothetical protein